MAELNADEQAEKLRASLKSGERELAFALERLEHVTAEQLSLGRRVAKEPWMWLGGAALIGLLWGISR